MTKIAIFDFDGTLADSFPWFLKRINHVAKVLRFKTIQKDDLPKLRLMNVQEILSFLEISMWKIPLIIFYMKRLMKQDRQEISLFKETPELLKSLKEKGIRIVILSTNSQHNVELVLKDSAQFIDHYFCGAGLSSKAKKFKKIKSLFPDAKFISIGDELRDQEAASREKIIHLNVSWGYADRAAFKGHEVVDSFSELETRILRNFNMKG